MSVYTAGMANMNIENPVTAFVTLRSWLEQGYRWWRTGKVKVTYRQVLVVFLLIVGLFLRIVNLGDFQPILDDEKTWLMVGTSVIQTGVPSTWTLFYDAYMRGGIMPQGNIVTPYLDHPPLFSLMVGGWAWLVGETDVQNMDWAKVRLPMIILSIATIGLLYVYTKRVFGPTLALFTLAAMVFFPSHVVSSRFVAAEHWIGFLLIGGLYAYDVYSRSANQRQRSIAWYTLGAISLTAILVKLSGVVVVATLIFLALYQRRTKLAVMLITSGLVSVLVFGVWGYFYNWEVFLNVLEAHHSRRQSFIHFWSIMTWYNIGDFTLYDPSMTIGPLGLIGLGHKYRNKDQGVYIASVLLIISLVFLYFSPEETYGWYKYMLYPLIGLGLGHVFYELYKGEKVYLFLFLPLVAMVVQSSNIVPDTTALRILLLLLYGVVAVVLLWRSKHFEFSSLIMVLLCILWFYEAVWVFNILWTARVIGVV